MRGQTEQMLLIKVLDDGDPIDFKQVKLSELVSEYLTPIAETWAAAESAIVVPPDRPAVDTPELLAESVAKGAELFRAKAVCQVPRPDCAGGRQRGVAVRRLE